MSISENLTIIKTGLPKTACLIAVSKTQPIDKIREAYQTGHKMFGENKAQEMLLKAELLPKDIEWHLIGHLQTNKVKFIAPFVSLIHSVDSFKLLNEINKQALKNDKIISCLLQVHIAKEESKFGFSFQEIDHLIKNKELKDLNNIKILGLMGMATNTDNKKLIREEFNSLANYYNYLKSTQTVTSNFKIEILSMGMSSDYEIALQEGSTMIRVGSSIFGDRSRI